MSPATLPATPTVPASGRITPETIFSSVLLPDPLWPIRPIDSPLCTSNETSRTA
jgi:hypothetical protein